MFKPDGSPSITKGACGGQTGRGGTVARVLIADDAAIVRKVIREMLEQAGHGVAAEATNGEEAVTRFAETAPDLAIIDVNMPVLDGFSAVAEIRRTSPGARLILASVHATEPRIQRAGQLGTGFLLKPFDRDALVDAVARELDRKPPVV
jgi:two-component system, chemotaxis family, chemotaxis protein CheY